MQIKILLQYILTYFIICRSTRALLKSYVPTLLPYVLLFCYDYISVHFYFILDHGKCPVGMSRYGGTKLTKSVA